ncbi:MAG TPA: energy transducer TonB [Gammaproteobacteria bacterium]|jgi:TonB family protein
MKIESAIKTLICSALLSLATGAFAADPAPAPTSTPAAAADNSQALAAFEAQLQKAVEKGVVYPKAAVLSGEHGTVVVEFDYAGDGRATNVTLGASDAGGHINRAAISTVEKAKLPPKPAELAGVMHFQVKLTYTLH